jgi:protein-tyrosine-phosphatase
MAEAFARAADPGVRVGSAGITPGAQVNPKTRAVMGEIGYDLRGQCPKTLQPSAAKGAHYIVVMGQEVSLETKWGSYMPQEIWDIPNPGGMPPEQIRGIREQIRARVGELLVRLRVSGEIAA